MPAPKGSDCARFISKCLKYSADQRDTILELKSDSYIWKADSTLVMK
jgi:hypothetical protein